MNSFINMSMTDDVDAIFEPASWLIKIDFINQFILNNNVLISVLGETGSGKTTFAHLLQSKLDPNIQSALVSATPLFEPSFFLSQLCSKLDIESKLSIADIAAEMRERQSRSLIIIDNAEQLPEAFIKELLNVLRQQEGNEFFHVCLLSDFSLVKVTSRLARELYQDMIHSIEFRPFNEDETKAYVTVCMAANDEFQVELTDEWIQEFYQLTKGNLTSMNTHMMSFFSKKPVCASSLYRRYQRLLPYGAISALALIVAGIGYYFLSNTSETQPFNTLAKTNIDSIQIELPLSSDIPNYQMASIHQPMEMVSLQKAELLVKNDDASDGSLDGSLVVMDKVVLIPKVMVRSTSKKNIRKIAKASVVKAKSIVRVAQTKPVSMQHAGRYTLQLMASRERAVLTRLARKYPASAHVKVRSFTNHGVHWYVLTQGDYTQKPVALHALATLPKSLTQFKPWVRSTDNLRDVG